MPLWTLPAETDYPQYYGRYIEKVPAGDLPDLLSSQIKDTFNLLKSLPQEKQTYQYAEGKWTILQIIQHLIDAERVFSYRAVRFARNDKTALPGFEEIDYAEEADLRQRTLEDLLNELVAVRQSTVCLIKSFTGEMLNRSGMASNNMITVKSICYIIAGHELHHRAVILERYLT